VTTEEMAVWIAGRLWTNLDGSTVAVEHLGALPCITITTPEGERFKLMVLRATEQAAPAPAQDAQAAPVKVRDDYGRGLAGE